MNGGYHELEIYNLSHALAVKIHEMSLNLPKFEMFEEASQIRRSSKSVSTNIVEGFALRKYKNEFLHYLYRAYGSSEETLEHLRYIYETKSLRDEVFFNELQDKILQLNGKIFRFVQSVEKMHDTPKYLKEDNAEYPTQP